MRPLPLPLALLLLLLLLCGCVEAPALDFGADARSAAARCVPGTQANCGCGTAVGVQACTEAEVFGPCSCPDASEGPDGVVADEGGQRDEGPVDAELDAAADAARDVERDAPLDEGSQPDLAGDAAPDAKADAAEAPADASADAAPDAAPDATPDGAPDAAECTPEVCDGVDNDCDLRVDEDLTEPCFDGPDEAENEGVCRLGERVCEGGQLSECRGQVLPTVETCDGRDEDCDGAPDEGGDALCVGRPSTLGECLGLSGCDALCAEGYHDLDRNTGNGCEWDCRGLPLVGSLVARGVQDFAVSAGEHLGFVYLSGRTLSYQRPGEVTVELDERDRWLHPAIAGPAEGHVVAALHGPTNQIYVWTVLDDQPIGPLLFNSLSGPALIPLRDDRVLLAFLAHPEGGEDGVGVQPLPVHAYQVILDTGPGIPLRSRLGEATFTAAIAPPLLRGDADRLLFVAPAGPDAGLRVVGLDRRTGSTNDVVAQLVEAPAPGRLGGDWLGDQLIVTHATPGGLRQLLLDTSTADRPEVDRNGQLALPGVTEDPHPVFTPWGIIVHARRDGTGTALSTDGRDFLGPQILFTNSASQVQARRRPSGATVLAWRSTTDALLFRERAACLLPVIE